MFSGTAVQAPLHCTVLVCDCDVSLFVTPFRAREAESTAAHRVSNCDVKQSWERVFGVCGTLLILNGYS